MILTHLSDYQDGWVVGDFAPSIIRTPNFEVSVKRYSAGDTEAEHFQLLSTEITIVVSGSCRLGDQILSTGDVAEIPPLESASFEALDDTVVVAIKTPSLPSDKILGRPNE